MSARSEALPANPSVALPDQVLRPGDSVEKCLHESTILVPRISCFAALLDNYRCGFRTYCEARFSSAVSAGSFFFWAGIIPVMTVVTFVGICGAGV